MSLLPLGSYVVCITQVCSACLPQQRQGVAAATNAIVLAQDPGLSASSLNSVPGPSLTQPLPIDLIPYPVGHCTFADLSL